MWLRRINLAPRLALTNHPFENLFSAVCQRQSDIPTCSPTSFFFSRRRRGRSFADDLQHGVAVLGAVVMDLLAEMGDERTGRHGYCAGGVELRPASHPPCA